MKDLPFGRYRLKHGQPATRYDTVIQSHHEETVKDLRGFLKVLAVLALGK